MGGLVFGVDGGCRCCALRLCGGYPEQQRRHRRGDRYNDCHTCPSFTPGHDPFAGKDGQTNPTNYLAGGVHFGPFTSRNLTPEGPEGKPADFTFAEFLHVLRTGEDLDKEHPAISPLLQVMPWPVFRNMTKRDIRAIYEYLRAIPHAEPGTCSGPATDH